MRAEGQKKEVWEPPKKADWREERRKRAWELKQAVFYSSSDQLGRDVLILSLSSVVALVLGVLMMRRGIAS